MERFEQECSWTFLLVLAGAFHGGLCSSLFALVRCWLSPFLSKILSRVALHQIHFPGNAFAMMEAQFVLASMAQRSQLQLMPGQRVESQVVFTVRPGWGLPMTLEPRSKMHAASCGGLS
jgi:hypothetical protein